MHVKERDCVKIGFLGRGKFSEKIFIIDVDIIKLL